MKTQAPVPVSRAAPIARQPIDRARHFGISAPHHPQAVVSAAGRQETVNCDGRGISCQFRVLEHVPGAHEDIWLENQIVTLNRRQRRVERSEPLAHPFGPGRAAVHEYRHVRAQFQAQRSQLSRWTSASPRDDSMPPGRSPHRSCRRPVRPPSGMRFTTLMSAPKTHAASALSACAARTHRSASGETPAGAGAAPNAAVRAHLDRDVIAEIDELEAGLQLMVAVGSAP